MKSANQTWMEERRSAFIIAVQRSVRSDSGMLIADMSFCVIPSMSCGLTSTAASSSRAAPANSESTSMPGFSGFCAATYSLATRFMPS